MLPCKAGSNDLAFCKSKSSQLWVPLLEKAYAKAHGSYEAISGGWISEAMLDLTGAPCEEIDFSEIGFDSETTWVRLLSFNEAHFPMGCSTAFSGEGIIGGHAYSILDVKELDQVTLGEQKLIDDFFLRKSDSECSLTNPVITSCSSSSSSSTMKLFHDVISNEVSDEVSEWSCTSCTFINSNLLPACELCATEKKSLITASSNVCDLTKDEIIPFETSTDAPLLAPSLEHNLKTVKYADANSVTVIHANKRKRDNTHLTTESGNLRVIRIRNPHGQTEWKGDFGFGSEVWTSKLAKCLDQGSKNDGTFWMSYHDFLRRYVSVDVCKAHNGWHASSYEDLLHSTSSRPDALGCVSSFIMTILEPTWMYLTIIQKTKRGRCIKREDRGYWYTAMGVVVLMQIQTNQESNDSKSSRSSPTCEKGPCLKPIDAGLNYDIVGSVVGACFSQPKRDSFPLELHLDPGTYRVVPMRFCAPRRTHVYNPNPNHVNQMLNPTTSRKSGDHFTSESDDVGRGERYVLRVFSSKPVVMEILPSFCDKINPTDTSCSVPVPMLIPGKGNPATLPRRKTSHSLSIASQPTLRCIVAEYALLSTIHYAIQQNDTNRYACHAERNDCIMLKIIKTLIPNNISGWGDNDSNCKEETATITTMIELGGTDVIDLTDDKVAVEDVIIIDNFDGENLPHLASYPVLRQTCSLSSKGDIKDIKDHLKDQLNIFILQGDGVAFVCASNKSSLPIECFVALTSVNYIIDTPMECKYATSKLGTSQSSLYKQASRLHHLTCEVGTMCSGGHAMYLSDFIGGIYAVNGWSCNLCGSIGRGVRWLCQLCSDDFCLNCVTKDGTRINNRKGHADDRLRKLNFFLAPKSFRLLCVCVGLSHDSGRRRLSVSDFTCEILRHETTEGSAASHLCTAPSKSIPKSSKERFHASDTCKRMFANHSL